MSQIREVEVVDSVDDLETSQSIRGHRDFRIFEMLDGKIASTLRKIILNSTFKKKVNLAEQKAHGRGLSIKLLGWTAAEPHLGPAFRKIPYAPTFQWWRTRFKTEVCSGSKLLFGSNVLD